MKKIVGLVLTLSSFVFCTERVTLTCKFEAIADGYEDKVYNVNLILKKNTFYNFDGTSGNNENNFKEIYGTGDSKDNITGNVQPFAFEFFDGKNYNYLYISPFDKFDFDIQKGWSLNSGEVICILKRGWVSNLTK